ncbi:MULTISPECIES: site-2 protease family protein [Micromonospora]|uniref:Zinc metalloprotease n=1 Tax=Micromonospora yangpuensis TaxID=683228 RepID=A0A1C6US67_9ACTN|nr:site-2 protease family protein [Micromonospora yangpuensis]GGM06366.1 peptidase M50 [Micromonospora yangpuensis]SCL56892.1 Zn-dependent protease (includes SpoIVFB) [Micromonospora yangpuensis]
MFGVPLHLNASMLLLTLLITVLYGQFAGQRLGLSSLAGYLIGFGFVVSLLGSVLLHELGHALTARRYGIGVRGITLELLGGYTEMDRDAPTPRIDLLVSLAGPAVSAVLGVAATVATLALPDRTVIHQLAFQLAVSNVIVAVFNLLPGLPLDGGRALRAAVWAVTRDRHTGTEVAGWIGRAVAAGTVALVLLLVVYQVLAPLALPLMLLVAFTLWRGAGQSIRLARIGRRLPMIDLSRLARPLLPVPSGTPLAEAQRRADAHVAEQRRADAHLAAQRQADAHLAVEQPLADAHVDAQPRADAGAYRPVVLGVTDSAGRPLAVVDPVAVAAVPAERRPWLAVDAVARSLAGLPTMPVDLDGERVLETVQTHPGAQYVVTSGENVVGVLHLVDLVQLLEPKRKMNT